MQTFFAHRACGILYHFIRQYKDGIYLLPANVCPVVPLTFKLANVPFEFVDISRDTWCMDEKLCLQKIQTNPNRYCGVVFVRTYGYKYDAESFFNILNAQGIKIIDDRCICRPDVEIFETFADIVLYSTGHAKYVDLGSGAYAYAHDEVIMSTDEEETETYDIEPIYKKYLNTKNFIPSIKHGWLNSSLIIDKQEQYVYWDKLKQELTLIDEQKHKLNTIYQQNLPPEIQMSQEFNQWRYNVLVQNKQAILSQIPKLNLFASGHYQPSSVLFTDEIFSNAEYLYDHVINLFNDKYFTVKQAKDITKIFTRWRN